MLCWWDMNKIEEDSLFAKIALEKGYLSRQQLTAVARVKRSNPQIAIAEICCRYRLLTPEQAAIISANIQTARPVPAQANDDEKSTQLRSGRVASQHPPSTRPELKLDGYKPTNEEVRQSDLLFARLLIQRGMITDKHIQKCLKELATSVHGEITLGQLLVKKRLLDPKDFSKIYRYYQDLHLYCCHCRKNYTVAQLCQLGSDHCPDCGSKLEQPKRLGELSPSDRPPATDNFGNYILVEEIARGGMGVVYKARQKGIDRLVALKVMRQLDAVANEQIARFQREIATVGKLSHPNIVAIYDAGSIGATHYFTMEYIAGETFTDTIKRQKGKTRQLVEIIEKVARAIHHAHSHNIIHRDLKPANILIDANGEPHVTDFGLAKDMSRNTRLTQTGATLGTPYYMAPEQIESQSDLIGPATDIYALGVILYEALSGKLPFVADSLGQLYAKILSEPPTPLRKHAASVPSALEWITLKAMAREIRWRYSSAKAMADDLKRFRSGKRIMARPMGSWQKYRRALVHHIIWVFPFAILLLLLIAVILFWLAAPFRADDTDPTGRVIAREIAEVKKLLAKRSYAQAQEKAGRLLLTYGQRPDILPLYRLHAQSYEGKGEFAQAHREYQRVYIYAVNAENELAAFQGMMRCQLATEDYLKAWKILQTTGKRFPRAMERFPELAARVCFHIGEFQDASRYFSRIASDASQGFYRNWLRYLTPIAGYPCQAATALRLVDIDNDGLKEVALVSPEEINIYRLYQQKLTKLCRLKPPSNCSFGQTVAGGDIDGDGNVELITVVSMPKRGYVLLIFTKKNGQFRPSYSHHLQSNAMDIVVAPITSGGPSVAAIAIGAFARNSKILYYRDGKLKIKEIDSRLRQANTDTESIAIADIDQDGHAEFILGTGPWSGYDLRAYGYHDNLTSLYLKAVKRMGIVSTCRVVDIDGDSRPEILIGKSRTVNSEIFGTTQPCGEPDGLYVLRQSGTHFSTIWQHTFPPVKEPYRQFKFLATGYIKGLGKVAALLYSCRREKKIKGVKQISVEQQVWLLWWNGSYQLLSFSREGAISGLAIEDIDNDGNAELLLLQPKQLLIYGIDKNL